MVWKRPLILASSSPRRVELLREAGFEPILHPPEFDDGVFTCGTMDVKTWVQSLAVFKALDVVKSLSHQVGTVLAADTVCYVDGCILGQPEDANEAFTMIKTVRNRSHMVFTGWCLISIECDKLKIDCEIAEISIGEIEDDEIEQYIASNQWKGKAGGYNLAQQIAAGWPITCIGDPTSVMGLPMNRIKQELIMDQN